MNENKRKYYYKLELKSIDGKESIHIPIDEDTLSIDNSKLNRKNLLSTIDSFIFDMDFQNDEDIIEYLTFYGFDIKPDMKPVITYQHKGLKKLSPLYISNPFLKEKLNNLYDIEKANLDLKTRKNRIKSSNDFIIIFNEIKRWMSDTNFLKFIFEETDSVSNVNFKMWWDLKNNMRDNRDAAIEYNELENQLKNEYAKYKNLRGALIAKNLYDIKMNVNNKDSDQSSIQRIERERGEHKKELERKEHIILSSAREYDGFGQVALTDLEDEMYLLFDLDDLYGYGVNQVPEELRREDRSR